MSLYTRRAPRDALDRAYDWRDDAACKGMGELFALENIAGVAEQKSVCARCPVHAACLNEAMREEGLSASHARAGVRGGLTPEKRYEHARLSRACETAGVTVRTARQIIERLGYRQSSHGIAKALGLDEETVTTIRKALGVKDPQAVRYSSPEEAYAAQAFVLKDGHVEWRGPEQISVRSQTYAVTRTAFAIHHGRAPEGKVTTTCGRAGCVAGSHLADATMRAARKEQAAAA
ncbi:WhiB family transcriptional regulator [Streptomyces sp. NPDC096153]|uniref:WhiB family transcriptional regulator n=1 Tax=Streptomyces sp. NPDC096153 TaxID=3155548 RepID=UPI00332F9C72